MRAVVFDLDGTIYYGTEIIEGANDVIEFFRKKGLQIFFLTNNSTKTRQEIYQRLLNIGVNCEMKEVMTSGYVAAMYAKKEKMKDIFIFGSENLKTEFRQEGIEVVEGENAHNLLIGYNPDFTYEDITNALRVALKANHIIACNKERYFPGTNAKIMPGCGAMVAPIEWCANREADYVIGKPNTLMLDIICETYQFLKSEIIMVGDTYESDIVMAQRAGCSSVYVGKNYYNDTICVTDIRQITNLKVFD